MDEFCIQTGNPSRVRVRRLPGTRHKNQNVQKIKRSGRASVSFCCCFCYEGIGPIIRSQGNFTTQQYLNFLTQEVIPFAQETYGDNFYILHDNSIIHR